MRILKSCLNTTFISKLEASNYALKQNVDKIDSSLARTQLIVYQNELYNELYNARKVGITAEDKDYYRSVDRKIFLLKIKLKMIEAKPEHYIVPHYLKDYDDEFMFGARFKKFEKYKEYSIYDISIYYV